MILDRNRCDLFITLFVQRELIFIVLLDSAKKISAKHFS